MAGSYDKGKIRALLIQELSLDDLILLCYDLSGRLYRQLAPGDTTANVADRLIRFGEQTGSLPKILAWVKERAPAAYKRSLLYSYIRNDRIKSYDFPHNEPYYDLPEREREIEAILKTLHNPRGRPTVLVAGLGGIGKTALAVEVVRRCQEDNDLSFEAITWDSAKQERFVEGKRIQIKKATIAYTNLINSLGRQLVGPDFPKDAKQNKEQILRELFHSDPHLIVVDNLETMDNAQQTLLKIEEKNMLGRSRLLLTSREQVLGNLMRVSLKGLSTESGVTFLKKEIDQYISQGFEESDPLKHADQETLVHVTKATKGMPLAMKLVVSQAAILGFKRALEVLQQGKGEIYFFIFLEAWRQLSDDAKKVLQYIGFQTKVVSRKELERYIKANGDRLDNAIKDLGRLSLIDTQSLEGLKQDGYTVHQLTRYFVINELPAYWRKQQLL